MYYIVTKIEWDVVGTKETRVGFLDKQSAEIINEKYESTFGEWIRTNKDALISQEISLSVFFETTPVCYYAGTQTSTLEGLDF